MTVQIGDSLNSILGDSVKLVGSAGRPSFSTLSAMPDQGLHVQPTGNSMSDVFARRSIGNLPPPMVANNMPAPQPGLAFSAKL